MNNETRRRPLARWFVDPDSRRGRRPLDVTATAVGTLVGVLGTRAALDRGPVQDAVVQLADSLPHWGVTLGRAAYALAAVYAVAVVLVAVLSSWRHTPLALTLLVAVPVAAVGSAITSLVLDGRLPGLISEATPGGRWGEPVLPVAALTAGLLVLRAWMVEPLRRYDATLVVLVAVGAWAAGTAEPALVASALGWGLAGAGAGLLVVGSPGGHPDLADVAASLRSLGVEAHDLHFADRQPMGARVVHGLAADGGLLHVKVYGRDALEAYRASRWWRTLVYRDQEIPGATRLQLVEHEALLTLLAEQAGVPVAPVVAAAETGGDALLVLAPPRAVADAADAADAAEEPLSDDRLVETWQAVGRLHGAGLCHGQLTLEHLVVPGGSAPDRSVVVLDLGDGAVAAPAARLQQDVATLLTSTALRVGPDRAVDAAVKTLGPEAVAGAQPYLQRAALPRGLRAGVRRPATVLSDLGRVIGERTGVAPAPPAPIVRVGWKDLLRVTIVLLAAYALLTALVQLDWNLVLESWANATWAWIVVGVLVAQVTTVCDAATTMSVVRTRLPLVPLVHLQYAIKLVGLAVSATAGRAALTATFVTKFGERPAVGVTVTALDSAAGSVVNIVITAVFLLVDGDLLSSLSLDADHVVRLLVLLALAAVASAVVVATVPKLRRSVVKTLHQLRDALDVVTSSPARTALLLGTNLASLMVTAIAMLCMVQAIHPGLSYPTVLAVTATSGLIASIIPVPSNVGVGEAAIAATLGLVGVPSAPAFAIAVTQRIATSYLPPVIGSFSLRWLRREDYL
ncbi:lysylphosphatidylglycerol synthase transmembrane domain-containing protein [Nocardioides sp. CER19]|uniref:lysylphosphatidylglycerol synthase transmembrane domain-containing protein n=1 Tax=Nocardioides sp. CER19 TaxID=3038538 RepID=UPI0024491FEC|nr:lysylphosphatidylglycerol synthase transmembrane domain-containing protein [Nocardioides sp. CER19]MDH2414573.1 lysylphosphatidylglycerol synthase transmembrane domain-containing protein [Nocardioides sp. CER19]